MKYPPLQNFRESSHILKERQIKNKFLRWSGNCWVSHSRKDEVESSILAFLNNLPSTANICFADTINSNVKYEYEWFWEVRKLFLYCSSVATYKISYHRTQLYRLIFLYRKHSAPVTPLNRLFSPMRAKIILKKTKLFFLCCAPVQNVCHRRKASSFGIPWPLVLSIINSISHLVQKKRPQKQFSLAINLVITYEQQQLNSATLLFHFFYSR